MEKETLVLLFNFGRFLYDPAVPLSLLALPAEEPK